MSSKFEQNISKWLEECKYQQVKDFILDSRNTAIVRENGMEIILAVCNHLNSEKTIWSVEMEECCEYSLLMVAQLSKPKEVLIALQEQVEMFGHSSRFKILLLPFQALLLRLPDKQSEILNMVLEGIGEHVRVLPLPDSHLYEGKDRILLDTDPKIQCISDIYEALAEFYAPFIKQMSLNKVPNKTDDQISLQDRRAVLKKNLLKIIEEPLVNVDLHVGQRSAPSLLRRTAEKLIQHLASICGDFFSLKNFVHHLQASMKAKSSVDDLKPPPTLKAIGTLFYLIYGEQFQSSSIPCVYSKAYVFHTVLPLVNILIETQEPMSVHKGLLLLAGVLKRVDDASLSTDSLDNPVHAEVFQSLVAVAVSCNVNEFKTMAVGLFRPYVNKLKIEARYNYLRSLLTNIHHPGVRGLIIDMIRDQIALCLDRQLPYFLNDKLAGLLPFIWKLPQDVETDLLEHMDPTLSALNLARYLLIRDKANASGMADHLKLLELQLLDPLSKGLKLSRAHYELELKKVESGQDTTTADCLAPMPQISLDQQRRVFSMALNSFDLLESVLARVYECLHPSSRPSKWTLFLCFHQPALLDTVPASTICSAPLSLVHFDLETRLFFFLYYGYLRQS